MHRSRATQRTSGPAAAAMVRQLASFDQSGSERRRSHDSGMTAGHWVEVCGVPDPTRLAHLTACCLLLQHEHSSLDLGTLRSHGKAVVSAAYAESIAAWLQTGTLRCPCQSMLPSRGSFRVPAGES
jgi:hypothetical protein